MEKTLEKLGLSDKEIKVYLSVLSLGGSSVRKIADSSGINRGTTYDILKHLMELDLVRYYQEDKKQYFIAEDPEKLTKALEKKKTELDDVKSEIEDIIPQLKSLYDNAEHKPVVKYYEGNGAVKIILEDVLHSFDKNSQKEYYVYSSSAIKKYLYEVYPEFSEERIKEGINVKVISIGPGGEIRGLDSRKWMSKKDSAPTYTLIYNGKVAMISVDKNNKPLGIVIEDDNIYQTQKMFFEFIWNKI